MEVIIDNVKISLASMYFDISRQIEIDLLKTEAIILHAMGARVLIAMDPNSKSTSWHDTLTNRRGRILEEFLMIKWLHKMNEENNYTTFRSRRGTSNIDITVTCNQILSKVVVWEIIEQECCSDHSTIRCAIGRTTAHRTEFDVQDVRCIVKRITKRNSSET